MKLIIAGATGLVGTEVLRQALLNPSITTITALARHQVAPPRGTEAHAGKLETLVLADWTAWTPAETAAVRAADACIWALGITPSKARGMPAPALRAVSIEYTLAGLRAVLDAREGAGAATKRPLEFLYVSGALADPFWARLTAALLGEYIAIRARAEAALREAEAASGGAVHVSVMRSGLVDGPARGYVGGALIRAGAALGAVPAVHVSELARVMLDVAMNGSRRSEWDNAAMVARGRALLAPGDYLK